MRIRILPEAEHDLALGADFYEAQGEGVGRYFNDCLVVLFFSMLRAVLRSKLKLASA
jgi:hypothetical protein